MLDQLRIALVCDWLTVYAGAESVLHELHELFPEAPIYTTLYSEKRCPQFKKAEVIESKLKYLPFARKFHRLMLPFMPISFERLDLDDYDLVISSSHAASKGVITRPETLHVSYCHSPMRYVWDQSHSYQAQYKNFLPLKLLYRPILHRIRMWDRIAADRVDRFIANSSYVGQRIQKYYGRTSEVIYPPIDLDFFSPVESKEDYFLAIGRLIPYKRFDLVIQACNDLGRRLIVVGDGPELNRLKKLAGPQVEFLGRVTSEELKDLYARAKALIFPQCEDFGIVPLEAMASGTPVIALGKGGALETVQEGVSGLFFKEQTLESLKKALKRFDAKTWVASQVAQAVHPFAKQRFKNEIHKFLENAWKDHREMLS